MLGLDQHEIGAIAVSRLLRDQGMEVIYSGRFNTPAGLVKTAIEEDADLIGLSCHSWEYLHYLPDLLGLIEEKGLDIPVIIGGSVITPGDADKVKDLGVAEAFGPSARNEDIVVAVKRVASVWNQENRKRSPAKGVD
jgi:methylmalonyl-CoA mutase C-terminal domain/subunit